MITQYIIKLINIYQRYLSPDHSLWGKARYPFGYCHFHPTCSEYAREALLTYGLFVGGIKAVLRILRCNPFTRPALDPVRKRS